VDIPTKRGVEKPEGINQFSSGQQSIEQGTILMGRGGKSSVEKDHGAVKEGQTCTPDMKLNAN